LMVDVDGKSGITPTVTATKQDVPRRFRHLVAT